MASTADVVTGLNTAGVSKIQAAITAWVNDINKSLTGINAANVQKAIKGSNSEKELKALSQSINDKIKNITKTLTNMNSQLDGLAAKYQKNDQGNTSFSDVYSKFKS